MSTSPDEPGVIRLTAEQATVTRGAANAILDAIDRGDIGIEDQFDPVRRIHLDVAADRIADRLAELAPDGTFSIQIPPSEQQALRDAIGAIEAMVTPPMSERLLQLGYRPDRDDLAALDGVLSEIPAPPREDLAFSDARFGGDLDQLRERTAFGDGSNRLDMYFEIVRDALRSLPDEQELRRLASQTAEFGPVDSCVDSDMIIVNLSANLASVGERAPPTAQSQLEDRIRNLARNEDCYPNMDGRRVRAAVGKLFAGLDRREPVEDDAFDIAEMVAWAGSNRQRRRSVFDTL